MAHTAVRHKGVLNLTHIPLSLTSSCHLLALKLPLQDLGGLLYRTADSSPQLVHILIHLVFVPDLCADLKERGKLGFFGDTAEATMRASTA